MTKIGKGVLAVAGCMMFFAPGMASAEKKQQLSGLALQQVQARDIEAPKAVTFPATISVLQDAGYPSNRTRAHTRCTQQPK